MNDEDLKAIEQRCDAATPGPWHYDSEYFINRPNMVLVASICQSEDGYPLICEVRYPRQAESKANINFIIHARKDIPALMAEVRRLRAALEVIAMRNIEGVYSVDVTANIARNALKGGAQ